MPPRVWIQSPVTLGQGQGRVSGSFQGLRLGVDGVVPPLEKLEAMGPIWGEIAELWVRAGGWGAAHTPMAVGV